MADVFVIHGGRELGGEIRVYGSKNATLPILAASLLNRGITRLRNCAMIQDVFRLADIMRLFGVQVEIDQEQHEIVVRAGIVTQARDPEFANALVRKLRGSVLLIGPLLARLGAVRIAMPGGDAIGARPLDPLFCGLRALGVAIENENGAQVFDAHGGLSAATIVMKETSVTATETVLMAASAANGITTIKLAAAEPHVQDVCIFLESLGIAIEGIGTNTIRVHGRGGRAIAQESEHTVISDSDEAMNLAVLCAATRSEVMIRGINPDFMDAGILQLQAMGANLEMGDAWMRVAKPPGIYQAGKIQCGLYPKLMSDQVPPFAVLATQAQGVSLIQEWMYEGRLGYVNELVKMGASAMVLDPHRAIVVGPTALRGAELKSLDIRAGMTMIIAGLVAQGETVLSDAHIIDRGFERIDERLRALGADIRRVAL